MYGNIKVIDPFRKMILILLII